MMLAQTQSLKGITSKIIGDKFNRHYVFWDLEKCSLDNAKQALLVVQEQYGLSDIFITSDFPKSFRAWCFSKVDFHIFLRILLDTAFVDWNFFYWTVQKGKATLRISSKTNRPKQKLVAVLKSFSSEVYNKVETVNYDTGTDKIGIFRKFDFDKNISEDR